MKKSKCQYVRKTYLAKCLIRIIGNILINVKNMNNNENNPKNVSEEEVENTNGNASEEKSGEENVILSDLDKALAEASDWKDKYVRLYAEFENFRKRTSKEKLDLIKTANEGLMSSLLPVVDDFDRALKNMSDDETVKPIKEGVVLISNKLSKELTNKGLQEMNALNEAFNSELHEAITQIPAPTPELKGKVVDVVEKGYFLGDKVIRFAKVVIGA
jgi:molecular chaperone GrpE